MLFISDVSFERSCIEKGCGIFSAQKTNYELFVNKKWNERRNLDESKQTCLKRVVGEWKSATDQERLEFLKAPLPVRNDRSRLDYFFKKSNPKEKPEEQYISLPPAPVISHPNTCIKTPNAATSYADREEFPSGKEKALIISFLSDVCVDTLEFNMANDLLSDKPLISSLTSLAYSWTEFARFAR